VGDPTLEAYECLFEKLEAKRKDLESHNAHVDKLPIHRCLVVQGHEF
jgi:hypothetical protein